METENVIIDTNILYSLVGLSQNEKIKSDLASNYTLWTTTVTLIEGITKYRNDLASIKKVLTPIVSEDIKLISIGHAPLSSAVILKIAGADSIDIVSKDIDDIFDLRIEREAEFLRWIFVIVIMGLFDVLRTSENYSFTSVEKNNVQLLLIQAYVEGNESFVLNFFKEKIREGFSAGNEQRTTLEAFQEMLYVSLNVFHFNFHQIEAGVVDENGISCKEADISQLKDSLRNDDFLRKAKKHVDNPLALLSKKELHTPIDEFLKTIKSGLKDEKNLTDAAIDFLVNKVEGGFKKKLKIRKNDIFDFLQIFSLERPGYRIITLDKGFIRMLKSVDKDSWDLIHHLGYDS